MGSSLSGSSSQSDNPNQESTIWWCRLLGRVIGAIAGIVSFVIGILVMISLNGLCILAGIIMLINGIIVLVFEVPVVFTFVEFTKPIAAFSERVTQFQRALIFGVLALIPIFMCAQVTTIFGNAPLFACAVLYGLMALGKKADREEMISRTHDTQPTQQQAPTAPQSSTDYAAAISTMESGMKGKLIDNDFQNIQNAAAQIPR